MTSAYPPDTWHDLFVAVAGAAASLTGLIFVAVSLNLEKIISNRRLPARAGESVGVLLVNLVVALLLLTPGQGRSLIGIELLALGIALIVRLVRSPSYRDRPAGTPLHWVIVPIAAGVLSSVPLAAAGIAEIAGRGGGLYWVVVEFILGFAGAVYNAWILLIEIHR